MRPDRLTIAILAIFAAAAAVGCSAKDPSTSRANGTSWGAQQLIGQAQDAANASLKEENRGRARELAEQGIELSERCLMVAPEEPGCYYWRAINTGLYHRVHLIGYQRGVKRMIDDCQKVIQLNPRYDHAGAYRILGELYTRLPQTGGGAESITRDLDLAEEYLRLAIRLAPDYPENHIALAQTLLARDNVPGMEEALAQAKSLVPRWKHDASYGDWRSTMLALEKKVNKTAR